MANFGDSIQFNLYKTMPNPDPHRLPVIAEEWAERARETLDDGPYYYIAGGAGGERTMRDNLEAFDRRKIVPRMLQNVGERDLEVELFGQTFPFPVLHAPIGVQSIIHEDGDLGSARACKTLGVPYIISSASTVPMERVAEELGDAPRWFQLYWGSDPRSEEHTSELQSRGHRVGRPLP